MKQHQLLLFYSFFIGVLSQISLLQAQETPQALIQASISGRVVDSLTNEPLAGVSIQLFAVTHQVKTDEFGNFKFITGQKLPLSITVSRVGYSTQTRSLRTSGETIRLSPSTAYLEQVLVTSRRRKEQLQAIPIPVSTINRSTIDDAGAFQVNRVKELVPSLQLYASNARNTTLNIRGLGSTFGLTNDGIDPGVGFYLDGVYLARPAATWLDFIDIEQLEVLRGPQGTLFGMNSTAGALNITSRQPQFNPEANVEISYGNFGFLQGKASLSGPISKTLAARLSFSGSKRDGAFSNVYNDRKINSQDNLGLRGQLLFQPKEGLKLLLAGDLSRQRPDGYGWPVAGVVKTKRADYRQFDAIIKDLGYDIPYSSAFERKIDLNTPSRADNELGGLSVNADIKLGNGTLTSTSAWRYWKWVPLNDRDYLGLPVFTISSGNSLHDQWSQEFRYSGKINERLDLVAGLIGLWQDLRTDPVHTEEAGSSLWRFAQNSNSSLWQTEGLFDHFGIRTNYGIKTQSLAAYGQLDWAISERFHLLPGLRYNYDKKQARYSRQRYGGLETEDPELLKLKNSVYTDQAFDADVDAGNFSGQLAAQYHWADKINAFASYAISYKPVGVNVGGLPTQDGKPMLELARVKPESLRHIELGVKTNPTRNALLNLTLFQTRIEDYQTLVQTPEPGVNRGYLANAEKVRVQGAELEGSLRLGAIFKLNGALAYTDARYIKFSNAPVPLEEVGGPEAFKDISGGELPGVSKWSGNLSGELLQKGKLLGLEGHYFLGSDVFARTGFSSSPSPSRFLNIPGYALLHARIGYKASNGFAVFVWGRNLTDKDYYEQLLAAPGSYGQYAGVVADPRTYGITLRFQFK